MTDKITLERIKLLHPKLRDSSLLMYQEMCEALKGKAMLRFAYTLRTFAEQDALFAQGRTTPGAIVTKAKGGFSYHNYGLAFDIVLVVDKDGNGSYESASWEDKVDFDGDGIADWQEVVLIAKKYGFAWGGDWNAFPDKPHFERTFGHSIIELKAMFDANKFIPNTNYLLI